jgi:hypothetical protein
MIDTFAYSMTLAVEECCSCGIRFAMPQDFMRQRRVDKAGFYCPNGHSQRYTVGEVERLRDELTREKQRTEQAQAEARHQRERIEQRDRRISAMKGVATKMRKRIAGGVCPCCNRTFQNLGRHMKGQHPTFSQEPTEEVVA